MSFEGLKSLSRETWTLTGAVTFYESEIELHNCTFLNAQTEDALNLVRSPFLLKNSLIQGASFDGLDVDFSKGEIRDCTWRNIGNDGIDFSGSIVKLYGCDVKNAGDKGISVGEESRIDIFSASVTGANIGMSAKDLSEVKVRKIWLNQCNQGIALYRKKPEYGPANVQIEDYVAKDVKRLHMVETGSELLLKGKSVDPI